MKHRPTGENEGPPPEKFNREVIAIKGGAMLADSKQTDICAYLSAILLGGLLLNSLLGWWWADSAAALVMLPIIIKEGIGALRGKTCCNNSCSSETFGITKTITGLRTSDALLPVRSQSGMYLIFE